MLQRLPYPVVVAVFCLMWSSAFAVGKAGLEAAPPLLLLTMRLLGAGVFLLGLAAAIGHLRLPTRRETLWLLGIGLANNALYLGFSYMGMRTVPAGLTSIIIGSVPVVTALVAALTMGEPMTRRKALGLVLGLGGLGLVVRGRLDLGAVDGGGLAFTFGALAMLTLGTVAFKRVRLDVGLVMATALQALLSGVVLLPVAVAVEDPAAIQVGPALVWPLAWLIVGSSGLAHLSWFAMLRQSTASAATAWHFLLPPLGLAFAWLLLGERPVLVDLLGAGPIVLGVWLVTRAAPPRPVAVEDSR